MSKLAGGNRGSITRHMHEPPPLLCAQFPLRLHLSPNPGQQKGEAPDTSPHFVTGTTIARESRLTASAPAYDRAKP